MNCSWYCIVFTFLICSCLPHRSFEQTRHPQAPDYVKERYWIALPWTKDTGDTIPNGCSTPENQKQAYADVFYVHPTGYLAGSNWNADLNRKRLNKRSDYFVQLQATAFNTSARIYAPRYRQAILRSYYNDKNGPKALNLAYTDVKASFDQYMQHWNNGRPFMLAGHSQGSTHLIRLIKEEIEGKHIQQQMVAAYVIGMPVTDTTFKTLPIADSATQVHCYITWNTYRWGAPLREYDYFKGGKVVNPLNWTTNGSYTPAEMNLGGVTFKFKRIDTAVCDAQEHTTTLWIHKPKKPGYYKIGNSYHLYDYNLFYMNIRQNALTRTAAYLKKYKLNSTL